MTENLDRWVSINEAAAIAGVSKRALYNWLADGKLITRRTVGGKKGSLRIYAASLFLPDAPTSEEDAA